MADESDAAFSIPPRLIEFILLGPADDRRQLQDSPILADVWLAYAANPAGIQDLLITPHKDARAGDVARNISHRIAPIRRAERQVKRASVAHLQGIVAARLYFDEVLRVLVPLTQWWHERKIRDKLEKFDTDDEIAGRIGRIFQLCETRNARLSEPSTFDEFTALDRYMALAGLTLWASSFGEPSSEAAPLSIDEVLARMKPQIGAIVQGLRSIYKQIVEDAATDEHAKLIFQVSLNRRAHAALDRSVPAVKADAARTLFTVKCKAITWAVLDAGIQHNHPAFVTNENSRVVKMFDFTHIRDIVSSDNVDELSSRELESLLAGVDISKSEAKKRLKQLARESEEGLPVNWDVVEELITLADPPQPSSMHGTHVAGIIGAEADADAMKNGYSSGMCPDIQLYDFRVLAKTIEDTEFAIIAALQYIRYVNEQHNFITIHGANLSLSIPHNVRNYACGRTPICVECEKLVDSGVVVVAAAGNRGYQNFETSEGIYESYAAFSITDPGNADGVITVGSTHGNWPHTYGVSFFSSRGPTGDGRMKPDLVAPGERILAPIINSDWAQESGTSMAAPHVSGAAAMLMARYSELIGQPRRIKRILCESATDLDRERSFQGHGMLDVLRAFQSI